MRSRVPRWLLPPILAGREETRMAAVLHWMLVILLGMVAVLVPTVLHPGVAPHRAPVWATDAAVVALLTPTLWLVHRGRVRLAAAIFSAGLWVVVTAATFVFGGITSPTIATYVTVGVLAGYFWGGRGLVGFSLLTAVVSLAMVWADYAGRVPEPLSPITPANAWITLVMALAVTSVLVHLAQRATTEALAEAARNERAHRESEERYRSLVEQSPDALFLHDERSIVLANPALAALLGARGPAELVGRDPLELLQAGAGDEARSRTARLLSGESPERLAQDTWTRLDDSRVPVEVTVRALRHGGRPAVQVLARDVSERAALEGELRQAQKMEAVGRLAGGIAHDFNNLLTAISGSADLLADTLPGGDAREDAFEIQRATERAAALVQQLLAFSRKQLVRPRIVAPNAVVREMERMLLRLLGEDLRLETALDPAAGHVRMDPVQLEQVVLNLVVNARDSMPSGGRIEVRTRRMRAAPPPGEGTTGAAEVVAIEVSDTGAGMDAETRARIFDPFFTTKGRFGGTGLGLSTVYGIVTQNGGSIAVDSAPGRGSTFRVLLPHARGEPDPEPAAPAERSPQRGSETILVAEDEASVRRFVVRVLSQAGYRVLEAGDGEDALALAERTREPIHLLVSDVVMPRLGGGALAERIKGSHPETRVLFLSGYPDDQLSHEGVAAADEGFLPKPFRARELGERVRAILDRAA